jgi:hypothetical protein
LNAAIKPRTQAILVVARGLLSPRLSIQELQEIFPCPKTASAAITWFNKKAKKTVAVDLHNALL